MFVVGNDKVEPVVSATRCCANDNYAVNFYMYHGSISYYALYSEGAGSYCSLDSTMYIVTSALRSIDMNFNTLANYTATPGYRSSIIFGCVGGFWLVYRAIVLTRSFRSGSRFGRTEGADLHVPSSRVRAAGGSYCAAFRLQLASSRVRVSAGRRTDDQLVPGHRQRRPGCQASVCFSWLQHRRLAVDAVRDRGEHQATESAASTAHKAVLFNTELTVWGELLFSIAMSNYLTSLNRTDLGPTRKVGEAISFYAWGLVNHGIIVLGQSTFILSVRAISTVVYVLVRFRSLKMLVTPCCVDSIMGSRYKIAMISGYEFRNSRLYYARETLKTHGLLKVVADDGNEYLAYHKIHWLSIATEDLTVVGQLTEEHVEPCPERAYSGPVSVCGRMLGGLEGVECCDKMEELESARLVNGSEEPSIVQ